MTDRTVLARVRELRGVTWDWKDTGTRGMGVIAQDVQKVFPDAVTADDAGYLRVDYHGLVGALVEAVKELADRVEELERRDRP
jgi:hypothetical protein